MILSVTYKERLEFTRDILAAYSSLDHRTTAELSQEEVRDSFSRLLRRLSALVMLHGTEAPRAMLSELGSLSASADPISAISTFLEYGRTDGATQPTGELQQELVHFSRIVDIGALGLDDADSIHALQRLHNSLRLPESMKVLSELMIVVRSRLVQRGLPIETPERGSAHYAEQDLGMVVTIISGAENCDYLVAIESRRRRLRRELGYYFHNLLSYLTPVEAAAVLWAFVHEIAPSENISFTAMTAEGNSLKALSWEYSQHASDEDQVQECLASLPVLGELSVPAQLPVGSSATARMTHGEAPGSFALILESGGMPSTQTLLPRVRARSGDPHALSTRCGSLWETYSGPEIASIECGHIHLDRDLDVDQETGAVIGGEIYRQLCAKQETAPQLTPMMDDDHVLVKLSPRVYRDFLNTKLGECSFHLIPESSPIIRSIVTIIYDRIKSLELQDSLALRGGNQFIRLPDGNYCELIEDISDACITGCVFFETALLTYRCAPQRFNEYFKRRFNLDREVHDVAAEILDLEIGHDEKTVLLGKFYDRFGDVTSIQRPDPDICDLVNSVLGDSTISRAHLNVLEDYYEVQQDKVRALISLLRLPFTLVSLHFNVATGRLALNW